MNLGRRHLAAAAALLGAAAAGVLYLQLRPAESGPRAGAGRGPPDASPAEERPAPGPAPGVTRPPPPTPRVDTAPSVSPNARDPEEVRRGFPEVVRAAVMRREAAEPEEREGQRSPADAAWQEQRRRLLADVGNDLALASDLLAFLGGQEDAKAALEVARLLPHVRAPGFEERLIAAATGKGPLLERRAALIGLRGRGRAAAVAVDEVAATAEDHGLRVQATQELSSHLADPDARPEMNRFLGTLRRNLDHEQADVRAAALTALLAGRRPPDAQLRARLETLRDQDPDDRVRRYAAHLLRRTGER